MWRDESNLLVFIALLMSVAKMDSCYIRWCSYYGVVSFLFPGFIGRKVWRRFESNQHRIALLMSVVKIDSASLGRVVIMVLFPFVFPGAVVLRRRTRRGWQLVEIDPLTWVCLSGWFCAPLVRVCVCLSGNKTAGRIIAGMRADGDCQHSIA